MRRHQILTGAANSGEHCYAIGSVEGVNFTVCLQIGICKFVSKINYGHCLS